MFTPVTAVCEVSISRLHQDLRLSGFVKPPKGRASISSPSGYSVETCALKSEGSQHPRPNPLVNSPHRSIILAK
ncbi:hypothetical protein BDP27DRAFT_1326416 [Rhodocollybia butyracea]|uniref:Uncharacterized protein n=1 Tax=Rhodocollybia butyracea TaxID=206335 RepID=A0A9P5PVL0_9AGAR|nr:hypothetical protein BDP27DRAFT_1326416 [Rhodocollybia butyracea]